MTRKSTLVARLIATRRELGDLAADFVFTGGSVVPILLTDEAAPDPRPTNDVDVIVNVLRRVDYYNLQERLNAAGFRVRMGEEVICRFRKGDLVLDVMPAKEEILNFSTRWYREAFAHSFDYSLQGGISIKVICAPYFLCTKFEAHQDRGAHDEKDLEDILNVLDGRPELLAEVKDSNREVRQFLASSMMRLIDKGLLSRLDWFVYQDSIGIERTKILTERVKALARIAD